MNLILAHNVPDYYLLFYTQWSQPFRTMISPNRSSIRSNTQSRVVEISSDTYPIMCGEKGFRSALPCAM